MLPNQKKKVHFGSVEEQDTSREIVLLPERETSKVRQAKNKKGCEQAKTTESGKKRLYPEKIEAGQQQPHKVASSTTCMPHIPTHTANASAALDVEEATSTQSEKQLASLPDQWHAPAGLSKESHG